MKCTDDIAIKDIDLSNRKTSRKDPKKHYLYVTLKNGEDFILETPKMRVSEVHMLDDKISVDLDLASDTSKSMSSYLDKIYNLIESGVNSRDDNYIFDSQKMKSFSLKINLEKAKNTDKTLFFDHESRRVIEKDLKKRIQKLPGRPVKIMARLDGLILDDENSEIKAVWSVDQALLFEEAPINPFGKNYCFIEDDEGYVSLED